MRAAKRRAMAGTSLAGPAPSEPLHSVMPVGGRVDGAEDEGEIVGVRDDARQAHERTRRVVGMDRHADADLLGDRDHLAQEAGEVVAQTLARHLAVAVEHAPQAGDVVAVEGAGQPRHDVGEQLALVALGRPVEPGPRPRQHLRRMVRLGTGALAA